MIRRLTRTGLAAIPAPVWLVAAFVIAPAAVAFATYRGLLIPLAAASVGLFGIVVTMTRPLPILLLYVVFIPVEALFVLGEAATVTRLVGIVFFGGYLLRRIGEIRIDAMPALGWAFVAWAAASVLWAIDPGLALTQFLTLLQLAVISVVIADLVGEDPGSVRPILWAYTGSAVVVAALGIGEYALAGGLGAERATAFEAQGPAHLAAVLLPAFFHLAFELVDRRRLLVGIALVIVVVAILLSGTRSAWFAIGLGVLVGLVPRLGARALVPGALLGLALFAALQVPEVGALFSDRLSSALETGGAGRVDIWSVGLSIIARNPIIGVGFENFPVAFTPEVIRSSEVPGLNLGILIPGLAPHSILIGTLAELGIVGLVLLTGFLVAVFLRPAYGSWSFPIKVMLLGLLFQSFFLDLLGRKQVWLIIALVLGLAVAELKERRRLQTDQDAEHRRFADRMRGTWAAPP